MVNVNEKLIDERTHTHGEGTQADTAAEINKYIYNQEGKKDFFFYFNVHLYDMKLSLFVMLI